MWRGNDRGLTAIYGIDFRWTRYALPAALTAVHSTPLPKTCALSMLAHQFNERCLALLKLYYLYVLFALTVPVAFGTGHLC